MLTQLVEERKSLVPSLSEDDEEGMFFDAIEVLQTNSFIQNKFQTGQNA
jgi:hypothetical protein